MWLSIRADSLALVWVFSAIATDRTVWESVKRTASSTTYEHPQRDVMTDEEYQGLTQSQEDPLLVIEAMDLRLHMQSMEASLDDFALCVWFACTDVCPPGG